jgi:hypothetical protein
MMLVRVLIGLPILALMCIVAIVIVASMPYSLILALFLLPLFLKR